MAKRSKRMRLIDKDVEVGKEYTINDAVSVLKKAPAVKFDQTVDIAIHLGVDPKKSDQQVRGTVSLPHGTGSTRKVLVFAKGEKIKEALAAGADFAGAEDLYDKVKDGWVDFDSVIATPDMMREVGKLGKVLGPKGLMPTPKAGTVTNDVATAVKEIKKGKIEFKVDKFAQLNSAVGKLSFGEKEIVDNITALLNAISRAKPSTARGQYFVSMTLSSTMGPGLRIDLREVPTV